MAHNKYLTLLFFVDNDSILVKSAAQTLSLNLEYTFLLLNFLIIGLFTSSPSCYMSLFQSCFLIKKRIDDTCGILYFYKS